MGKERVKTCGGGLGTHGSATMKTMITAFSHLSQSERGGYASDCLKYAGDHGNTPPRIQPVLTS